MLIKAIENIPQVAIQSGSLLLVKITDDDGQACLQVRTLSQREMIQLEKHQHLLTSPSTVLRELSRLSADNSESVQTLNSETNTEVG